MLVHFLGYFFPVLYLKVKRGRSEFLAFFSREEDRSCCAGAFELCGSSKNAPFSPLAPIVPCLALPCRQKPALAGRRPC